MPIASYAGREMAGVGVSWLALAHGVLGICSMIDYLSMAFDGSAARIFSGTYRHTIDRTRRVSVPPYWLHRRTDEPTIIVLWKTIASTNIDGSILRSYDYILDSLTNYIRNSGNKEDIDEFEYILANSYRIHWPGRVTIPKDLFEKTIGLRLENGNNKVTFVGCGPVFKII